MRILKALPLIGGLLAVGLLIRHFGLASLTDALTRIAWWQFLLVCLVYGITMVLDTLGWRYTLVADQPPFVRLLAARCAGQAVNVITALGGVGGEAIKAWLIRRDIPYEASVPSLILAKTAEVVGQTLLLVTGILVAWATGVVGWSLLGPMCYLLLVEVIGVGGFILAQVSGGVGRVGRLLAWVGAGRGTRRVDGAVRGFYRAHWRSLLVSIGLHFTSWLVGAIEVLVILWSLHVGVSLATATVVDALGTGVRFATFFVPASLGTLEGAYAVAFTALGWAASDGLAFSLVRRGRQAVWIGIGLAVLGTMGATRTAGKESVAPEPVRAK
ncbi:MAG TPA: lysylphosphatidylglycerol synthase transmembrane domain-containing protein [Methylomirabilota bacterium]